jgi:proteasome lid subunit RPN8/RPN11
MLTPEIKDFIKKEAQKVYPNECCGFILDNGNTISCKNISSTPEKSFIIGHGDINKYGLKHIIGVYHSHKDYPEFSIADIAFSEKLNKICILYIVDSDNFKEYKPNGMEIPYQGRPFIINGQMFCLPLIRDYYRRELNIILSEFSTPFQLSPETYMDADTSVISYNECSEIITNYFFANNFIQVDKPSVHDIIQIKLPSTREQEVFLLENKKRFLKESFSLLIYLKNKQVLHNMREFSCIESYRAAFDRLTTHIFRHKLLL